VSPTHTHLTQALVRGSAHNTGVTYVTVVKRGLQ